VAKQDAGKSTSNLVSPSTPAARVAAFIGLLAVLVSAVSLLPVAAIRPLSDGTALMAHRLLSMVGLRASLLGNEIRLPGRTLLIAPDCTGAYLLAVFAALVITYNAPLRDKLRALAIGVPSLLGLNMARLVGAGLVAVYLPSSFEFLHDYIFVVLLMFAVLALWLLWLNGLRERVA